MKRDAGLTIYSFLFLYSLLVNVIHHVKFYTLKIKVAEGTILFILIVVLKHLSVQFTYNRSQQSLKRQVHTQQAHFKNLYVFYEVS